MASAVVEITTGPSAGKSITFAPGADLSIGRGAVCNEGKIDDATISRVHGTFTMAADGTVTFADSSRNGTWYVERGSRDPSLTLKESSTVVRPGDSLLMGHTTIKLVTVNAAPLTSTRSPGAARASAPDIATSRLAAPAVLGSRPSTAAAAGGGAGGGGAGGGSSPSADDLSPPSGITRKASSGPTHREAEALWQHPFTRLLAAGPPRGASGRALTDAEVSEVGKSLLRSVL